MSIEPKNDIIIINNENIEDVIFNSNPENRLSIGLLRYWDIIRKDRLFPSESKIVSQDIPDIWESCYLIQVNDIENRKKVDFTYMGAKIIEAYHNNLSEKYISDIISPKTGNIAPHFRVVIEEKKPVLQHGEFSNNSGGKIKFRQCTLPFGETDEKVDTILGCVGFKVY